MLALEAKALAHEWVQNYNQTQPLLGAYLNGSLTTLRDKQPLSPFSDVDINLVLSGPDAPPKIGKIHYKSILLDVSFVPEDSLFPPKKLLSTYEICGAFRTNNILFDPSGRLSTLVKRVSTDFARPIWVKARLDYTQHKIIRGQSAFQMDQPLLENLNAWLFPAGICCHLILVGALSNPTVRLRYLVVRQALHQGGFSPLYEELLALIGCESIAPFAVQRHLNHLTKAFDAAAPYATNTPFPFSADLTPAARSITIDGSQQLINEGNHREAMFWVAATFIRCHLVLKSQNPALHYAHWLHFMAMLQDMGASNNQLVAKKQQATLALLPKVQKTAQAIYQAIYTP